MIRAIVIIIGLARSRRERSFSRFTVYFVGEVWKPTRESPAVLPSSCEQAAATQVTCCHW